MYSPDFETFWKAYPRRIGKFAAFQSWKRHKVVLADVLAALEWQVHQSQWMQDGGKFIPHPTTYLNQHRWEDEPPAVDDKRAKESAYPTWY